MDKIGKIAFIAGVVISIIAGFLTANWIYWALTLLGIVVGFLNVGQKEVKDFLGAGYHFGSGFGSNHGSAGSRTGSWKNLCGIADFRLSRSPDRCSQGAVWDGEELTQSII